MSGYNTARRQNTDDDEGPLPQGWEMRIDGTTGWPFYIDHINKGTTWQDPRINRKYTGSDGMGSSHQPKVREIPVIREDRNARGDTPGRQTGHVSNGAPVYHEIPVIRQKPADDSRYYSLQDQFHEPFAQRTDGGFGNPIEFSSGRSGGSSRLREIPVFSADNDTWDEMDGARTAYHSMPPSFSAATQPTKIPLRGTSVYENVSEPQNSSPKSSNISDKKGVPVVVAGTQSASSRVNGKDSMAREGPTVKQTAESDMPLVVEPAPPEKLPSASEEPATVQEKPVEPSKPGERDSPKGLNVEGAPRGRSPSPAPPNLSPMELIDLILREASGIDIANFQGTKGDKQFLLYEEMLTRLLIKLDRIDSEGRDDIRSARREAVRVVQSLCDLLESKATTNKNNNTQQQTKQESDKQSDTNNKTVEQIRSADNEKERSPENQSENNRHLDETKSCNENIKR